MALGRHRVGLLVDCHALPRARDVLTHRTGFQGALGSLEPLGLTLTVPGGWRGKIHRGLSQILARANYIQDTRREEEQDDAQRHQGHEAPQIGEPKALMDYWHDRPSTGVNRGVPAVRCPYTGM